MKKIENKIIDFIKKELKYEIEDVDDGAENSDTFHFQINDVDKEIVNCLKSLDKHDLRVNVGKNVVAAIYYTNFYNEDYEVVVELF